MFKCVLKSLSDTELVSIASEVTKPEIKTKSITSQLVAKSNSPIIIFGKPSVVRTTLVSEVLSELSFRLSLVNKSNFIVNDLEFNPPSLSVINKKTWRVLQRTDFELENEIKRSKYITKLEYDWDDLGAQIVPPEIYNASIDFLISYSKYISSNYLVLLSVPEINPCRNGTIDLSWRTIKARLLINIREDNGEIGAFFYGDLYNNNTPLKGNVRLSAGIVEHLAVWMKNYLPR